MGATRKTSLAHPIQSILYILINGFRQDVLIETATGRLRLTTVGMAREISFLFVKKSACGFPMCYNISSISWTWKKYKSIPLAGWHKG